MKSRVSRLVLVGVLFSSMGSAGGEGVSTPYFAQCVAQLEGDTELAVEFCRSKRARAVLAPGSSSCATSWRLISGRASCTKDDSASAEAASNVGFSRYFAQVGTPISIGSLVDFYGGRHAGDDGRFRIVSHNNGIKLRDTQEDSASLCVFQPNAHSCNVRGAYVASGRYSYVRSDYTYTLRLDGLMVEEAKQRRNCADWICPFNVCSCRAYAYPPPERSQFLHLWQ